MIQQTNNKIFGSKISVESQRKSGQMSLQRLSWTNRDHSINQKCSLIQVKSIQGQRKSDIFEHQLCEKNQVLKPRISSSIFYSGLSQMHDINQQTNEDKLKKTQQRIVPHNCTCFGECSLQLCPCFQAEDQLCIKQQCCGTCIQLKVKMMQSNSNTCTCKNSKCLKSYCKCFQNNIFCGKSCKCQDCANKIESEERQNALEMMKNQKNIEPMSCTCKKTKCNKKYCSCFANGIKCSSLCTCQGCKNSDGVDKMEEQPSSGFFIDDEENSNLVMPNEIQFEPPKFGNYQ